MPEFTIEMLWNCSVCKAERNLGLERHCRNCGHPKDDRDAEYMPDVVTVANALEGDKRRRAEAGPDWKCGYCGSLQNPLNKCCTECGVSQDGPKAKKEWSAPVETATFDPTTGDKASDAPVIYADVAPHVVYADVVPYEGRSEEFPRRSRFEKRRLAIVVGGALLLVFFGWLLFHTRTVDARVATVQWKHSIKIDRYQVWHRDGWSPDPSAYNIIDEGRRVHHYDHVLVGSHQEHYTARVSCGQTCRTVPGACHTTPVRCTSNKNGTASCSGGDRVCDPDTQECETKYCNEDRTRTVDDYEDQPRYQEYYAWDVWDWGYSRTVSHTGSTTEESWPSDQELKAARLGPGEREREGGRVTEHDVTCPCGSPRKGQSSPENSEGRRSVRMGRSPLVDLEDDEEVRGRYVTHPAIGQLWQLCATGQLFRVADLNDSRESPGSFVMHAIHGKGVKYLHRNALMRGEWACMLDVVRMIAWHRLLVDEALPV